jgi:hypothetical protein
VQTLFIVYFCPICQKKKKSREKMLLPAEVSKSAAHTVTIRSSAASVFQMVTFLWNTERLAGALSCLFTNTNYFLIKLTTISTFASKTQDTQQPVI